MQTVKNVTLISKKDCTGCHACYNKCPVQAIEMLPDREGFLYPSVIEGRCVQCRSCLDCCPVWNKPNTYEERGAYAAYAKEVEEHMTSSSGGVFAVLARYFLRNGGYVCGAAFDEGLDLKHILTNKEEDLTKVKGTKYVQSELGNVYSRVKELLEAGTMVLFSGTPCQVGGLRSYLNKEYDELLTVDLICHGVPSPRVFKRYLSEIGGKFSVKEMSFRDKTNGISDVYLTYRLSNGETIREKYSDSEYIKGFIQNLTIRPSCFRCRFKGLERCSDITIGDYWGLNDYHPEMITKLGTSAVLVHSKHGQKYFDLIKDNLEYAESKPESIAFWNSCLEKSVEYNPSREEFFSCIEEMTIKEDIIKLYKIPENKPGRISFAQRIVRKAKSVIKHVNR